MRRTYDYWFKILLVAGLSWREADALAREFGQ